MLNKKKLGILGNKIRKYIASPLSDQKIEKILDLLSKYNKKLDFNENFKIIQTSYRSFLIFTHNCVAKIFFNFEDFSCEYFPIKKLNNKKYDHVIKLLDFDEQHYILILEKVEVIYNGNTLKPKFANKKTIKELLIVIMKSIHSLFILNQQVNKDFSYKNVGYNKDGKLKVFDWELSCYIDPDNKYIAKEELYRSFKNFTDELSRFLKQNELNLLNNLLVEFINYFEEKLTDTRNIEKPNISGKYKIYKFKAFKFLNFNEIINLIIRW